MNIEELRQISQLGAFLSGAQAIAFKVASSKDERYAWIKQALIKFRYSTLKRAERGVLIAFLCKVSGYSHQQVTRLIKQYREKGTIARCQKTTNGFQKKYSDHDIRLLIRMDERHETPSGGRIKKLCERATIVYYQDDYKNLSKISISHLYNLRQSNFYKKHRRHIEKTKYTSCSIGQRRKPNPQGIPGFIRIDTVHQGDLDKEKGIYHINAVDEVTQFEVVISVEKISERCLIPALKILLSSFPFILKNFHSDNGSEYVNRKVEELLKKLLVEFTKSRPRQSNDNALAESKNASVVRKMFGYAHIPQKHASKLNEFNRLYLNPFVNYHRPCYFPEEIIDAKGRIKKRYPYKNMMTPYRKLKSIPNVEIFLKPGMTMEILDRVERSMTDNEAADKLLAARKKLFKHIHEQESRRMAA